MSIMLMKSSSTLLFLICFQFAWCVDIYLRWYQLESPLLTWDEAYKYCLANYTDLVNIRTQEETELVNALPVNRQAHYWIGLNHSAAGWKWTGGETLDTTTSPLQPVTGILSIATLNCAGLTVKNARDALDCSMRLPFLCSQEWDMVLVKENKTWEEALEHCRVLGTELFSVVTQYSPPNQLYPNSYGPSYSDYPDHQPIYDLPSLLPEDQIYIQNFIQDALTDEVWTSLRFLAGEWLWVNGDTLGTGYQDLPGCPDQERYCGTLPKNGAQLWDIQDCREKRNFLCMKKD